ncbi:hypothetical protein TrispH2_011143 [Trichoplax sp. H2]|nr:hypothetical protein TrispH2_011143 [Trichoplax sp. H2]|eukprot:RDD37106.1 hypothetical protein TrispH2_011143 [Trichoplax sp. H2]
MTARKSGYYFPEHHLFQYGLKVAERNKETGIVEAVFCRFCIQFGSEKVNARHKQQHASYTFTRLFSTRKYVRHHKAKHPKSWAEYENASDAEKCAYFDGIDQTDGQLSEASREVPTRILVSKLIIEEMIVTIAKATSRDDNYSRQIAEIFQLLPLDGESDIHQRKYRTDISNLIRYRLTISYLKCQLSFHQIDQILFATKNITGIPSLRKNNYRRKAVSLAYIICAHSLQMLSNIMSRSSTFTMTFHIPVIALSTTKISYLQVRIGCYGHSFMYSFHTMMIPLKEIKDKYTIFEMLTRMLNALCPHWRQTLVTITLTNMQKPINYMIEIMNKIKSEIQRKPIRLPYSYCALRLNEAAIKSFRDVIDKNFYTDYHKLLSFLSTEEELIDEINSLPLLSPNASWQNVEKNSAWFHKNYLPITKCIDERKLPFLQMSKWWYIFLFIHKIVQLANEFYAYLEESSTSLDQRKQFLSQCFNTFVKYFKATGPMTDQDRELLDRSVNILSKDGKFAIRLEHMQTILNQLGIPTSDLAINIHPADRRAMANKFGIFAATMLEKMFETHFDINKEGENINDDAHFMLLPYQLIQIQNSEFKIIVQSQCESLGQCFSTAQIDRIEQDHQQLKTAYQQESTLKDALDNCNNSITFYDGWSLVRDRFPYLQRFVGELALAFPNAAVISTDCLPLNWEKEYHHYASSHFLLESILHSKQYDILQCRNEEIMDCS